MNKYLLIMKRIGLSFTLLLFLVSIYSLFNLFGFFNPKVYELILIILVFIYYFILGFHMGKYAKRNLWLNGLIYGGIYFLIHFILSLFIGFNKTSFIYILLIYLVILMGNIFNKIKKR